MRGRGESHAAPAIMNVPGSELCHKFKRLRLFEPSVGVLGFVLVAFCVVCGFFYLDYRRGYGKFSGRSERFVWLQVHGDNDDRGVKKFDFLERNGDGGCDLFEGDWVWDDSYPLYESRDCKFLDGGFRCSENGRPDSFYTKWRWQPRKCNLPRFLKF